MVSVIAHHPYEATQDDEISFKKDDLIKVTDNSDSDWWFGTLESTGAQGLFPSNFVTIVTDEAPTEKASEQQQETGDEQEEEEVKEQEEEEIPEKKDSIIGMARVMEDYASQEGGELSLHRGGIINVYEVIDSEWSRGEINGKVGKYPTKYTEDIDMPGRPDFGMQANDAVKKEQEGGFKLAAFGVKQGGIGSLFGGGFPGLKKTNPKPSEPTESKPSPPTTASVPNVPVSAPSVPKPTEEQSPVEEAKPTVVTELAKPEQSKPESPKKSLGKAIVLHPFDANNEDELSLLRGEYVDILDREADDGWWEGKNERGELGVFPSDYVKELQEDLTTAPPPTRARRSIQTPTSPTGHLPPIPSNTRPPASRPVTVQPSSNTPPIPSSAPRPSSVNSPAPTRAPPPFEKKHVLPVANVDQDVEDAQLKEEESKPTIEEEEEEAFVDTAPEPKKEEQQDIVKENLPQEVSPQPITPKEEPVVQQVIIEEEKKVEEEKPSVEKEVQEEEEKVEAPIEEKLTVEEEEEKSVEEPPVVADDEKKVETLSADDEEESKVVEEPSTEETPKEEQVEEPTGLNTIAPSGPKLTTPSRARIGGNRARRNITPTSEPSQTQVLQQELEQMPEPEKKAAPPKPVKPIFAKFPTPFATGEEITKHQLKPVTRRPWEVKQQEQQEAAAAAAAASSNETEEQQQPRPTGVKNLASRFNFAGSNSSGGNEVLETKLKNHTKNEVERVRKEFEHLLQEEREKRSQLEDKVAILLERLEALESQ